MSIMNTLVYYIPKRVRRRLGLYLVITLITTLLLLIGRRSMLENTALSDNQLPVIISLTSTHNRLNYELPVTIMSLLQQKPLTKIHIYVPSEDAQAFEDYINKHPSSPLCHDMVSIIPTRDVGSATKFIPAIESHASTQMGLIICDDDHFYSLNIVSTLSSHFARDPSRAYSIRGYRIRPDFRWGVIEDEYNYHVINGWHIKSPYQTGIMTANECYIINSIWFANAESPISDYSSAPEGARLVDDIWINGHLSKLGIKRYVVPLNGISIDIAVTKTLDAKMTKQGISRAEANDQTLSFFSKYFDKERIFYDFDHNEVPDCASFYIRKVYLPIYERLLWIRLLIYSL
jgi:hypothetical protein